MKRFRPGVSFSDFVVTDVARRKSRIPDEVVRDYRRGWLVWLMVVVAFGIVVVRLVVLQVFFGGRYAVVADENRIKRITMPARRGTIYDRFGQTLAKSVQMRYTLPSGLSGEIIEVDGWAREYPLGEAAAHAVGYLGEVVEDEVGILKGSGQKYEAGEGIGRAGLE